MPPKKVLKASKGQKTLTFLFNSKSKQGHEAIEANGSGESMSHHESLVTDHADSDIENESTVVTDSNVNIVTSSVEKNLNNGAVTDSRKFQSRWLKLWPWLVNKNGKMFCNLCIKAGKTNTFTSGCETYKTSSLTRHEVTIDHKNSIESPDILGLKNNMATAINNANCEQDAAIIKTLKIVNWIACENIPLSKFESLLQLLKDLGVTGLSALKINDRVDYESYYSANELLKAISEVIDEDVTIQMNKSPCVTIFADESTDIANKKRMTMTARVIDPLTSVPSSLFLRDIEYEDGTGEGLASEIKNELERRNVPFKKVTGFGSDGASVMTGLKRGVSGRLKELNPHILNVHCIAHRLALCTEQAAEGVPSIKKFQDWMTQLFYYFKVSATREKELHHIQEILDSPKLKYKEVHAVRWLSFYEALNAIFRTLDPLITYLHNRQAQKDPKAKGLLKQLATKQFIYIAYLMMDVLPIVSKLCLVFQKEDLDVAIAKISLDLCLKDLESYLSGTQIFPTNLENFENVVVKVGDHYEYKGHRLTTSNLNLNAVKSQFVNRLISNIRSRFPQKSIIDNFYVLAMRSINLEDVKTYGCEELDKLLEYYGEEQTHQDQKSPPIVNKEKVKEEWYCAKSIVKAAKYPVDNMPGLWQLLTTYHRDELSELLKLVQIALTLPLHTASCERVFSQQNLIVTRQRSRLSPEISDRLLRVRLYNNSGGNINENMNRCLIKWHTMKKRLLKTSCM